MKNVTTNNAKCMICADQMICVFVRVFLLLFFSSSFSSTLRIDETDHKLSMHVFRL